MNNFQKTPKFIKKLCHTAEREKLEVESGKLDTFNFLLSTNQKFYYCVIEILTSKPASLIVEAVTLAAPSGEMEERL